MIIHYDTFMHSVNDIAGARSSAKSSGIGFVIIPNLPEYGKLLMKKQFVCRIIPDYTRSVH
jgi:hypothetical protein